MNTEELFCKGHTEEAMLTGEMKKECLEREEKN